VIMRAMTSAAGSLARAGYDEVWTSRSPRHSCPQRKNPEGRAAQLHRAAPAARNLRGSRPRSRRGKIAKYDRGFYALFAAEERHLVAPDDGKIPKAIAEIIFGGLKKGRFRVGPAASAPPSESVLHFGGIDDVSAPAPHSPSRDGRPSGRPMRGAGRGGGSRGPTRLANAPLLSCWVGRRDPPSLVLPTRG
jgi:hypothetical protein